MTQVNAKRGISFSGIIFCAVVSCLLGIYFAQESGTTMAPKPDYVGTVLTHARPLSNFSLQGTDGQAFTNEALKKHWTLAFFGFTQCAMMCPTAMQELATTYHLLEKAKVKIMPQVLMVSVDPQRDTLDRIKSYVTGFNPNFMGATGTSHSVRALSTEMGIAYEKVAGRKKGSSSDYDIQHSGAIIVINPKGEIQAFFNWPHKPQDMANDFSSLVNG